MSKHTIEPWVYQHDEGRIVAPNAPEPYEEGTVVVVDLRGAMGGKDSDADARRIVACVNELAGKPEGYVAALEKQRDDLLAATVQAESWLSEYEIGPDSGVHNLLTQLRTAIANAKETRHA